MSVAVAVARTVHSLRSTICLLTQISSTRADFIPPISSLQLQRMYSRYTAKLHRYSRCLPFILCTNHEFPMELARLELMLSYEQYTLKLEELLMQSLHYCLAPSVTSFSQHQLPSILDYDFTLLARIAFLDHVCFLSIISARVELMRSVPSLHAQHTTPIGGLARLDLMHCYRCVHFLLLTYIHLLSSVPHFLHVVYHFFIVLQVDSICCPPFSLLVRHFCTSTYCSQVPSRHCTT